MPGAASVIRRHNKQSYKIVELKTKNLTCIVADTG
jgi:hypothetical protein